MLALRTTLTKYAKQEKEIEREREIVREKESKNLVPCAHHTRDRDGNSVCGYKRYDKQLKDNRYIYMYNRYMYILYIYTL